MEAVLTRLEALRGEILALDSLKLFEIFMSLDKTRSGKVTRDEFTLAMQKIVGEAQADSMLCEAFFELCDPDGGRLDYREIVSVLKKTMQQAHAARRRKYLTASKSPRLLRDAHNIELQQGPNSPLRRVLDGSPHLRRASLDPMVRRASSFVPPPVQPLCSGGDPESDPAPAPSAPSSETTKLQQLVVPGLDGRKMPLPAAAYMRPTSSYVRTIRRSLELNPNDGVHLPHGLPRLGSGPRPAP